MNIIKCSRKHNEENWAFIHLIPVGITVHFRVPESMIVLLYSNDSEQTLSVDKQLARANNYKINGINNFQLS